MADNPRGALFRVIQPDRPSRVTNAELFFDLVFVYAVTQLSHTLLAHFTARGAIEVTLLFLAIWWVWAPTSNESRPSRGSARRTASIAACAVNVLAGGRSAAWKVLRCAARASEAHSGPGR